MSHTKGPWHVEGEGIRALVRSDTNSVIVCVRHRTRGEEWVPTARLIAAAPTGHELIQRAVADRIDDQWLKDARTYLEAVNATR